MRLESFGWLCDLIREEHDLDDPRARDHLEFSTAVPTDGDGLILSCRGWEFLPNGRRACVGSHSVLIDIHDLREFTMNKSAERILSELRYLVRVVLPSKPPKNWKRLYYGPGHGRRAT